MTQQIALLTALATSLTWGLTGVLVQLLPSIPPVTLTAGRLVIAFTTILPVLLLFPDLRRGFKQALRHRFAYILALLLTGYYLLATAAFQMAPVAEVALLLSTPPLFVLVIRRMMGEPSTGLEIGGALLAAGGVALILAPKIALHEGQALQQFYGDMLAVCAAVFTAIYAYTYRFLAERGRAPETVGVSLLTFVIGSVTLMLAVWITSATSGLPYLDTNAKLTFVGLGVICTAVPTLGFALSAKHLPAIITATISLFIPVFASVFALLILEQRLPPMFFAGCAVVLAGVAMIIRK